MKSFAPSPPGAPRGRAAADIILAIDTSTEFCSVAVCLPIVADHDGGNASLAHPAMRHDDAAIAVATDEATAPIEASSNEVRVYDDPSRGVRFIVVERDTGAVSSTYILPAVDQALQVAGVTLQDCAAVAFGAGPGSFTGLRTATGIVQGLAFAAGLPVVPVNTLMACAESARLRGTLGSRERGSDGSGGSDDDGAAPALASASAPITHVIAALDARMNECYFQAFRWTGEQSGWQASDDSMLDDGARVGAPEAVMSPWEHAPGEAYAVVGNAVSVFGKRLAALDGAASIDALARPDAAAVASIGWQAWRAGQVLPAALALPNYVRNKVAQTTEERERIRQQKEAMRGNA